MVKKSKIFGKIFPKISIFFTHFSIIFRIFRIFFRSKISGENRVFLLENCDFFARKKCSIQNFEIFSSTFFFKIFSNITSGFQRCRISSFIRNKQLFRKKKSGWRQMTPLRNLKRWFLMLSRKRTCKNVFFNYPSGALTGPFYLQKPLLKPKNSNIFRKNIFIELDFFCRSWDFLGGISSV